VDKSNSGAFESSGIGARLGILLGVDNSLLNISSISSDVIPLICEDESCKDFEKRLQRQ
jgi:hypothetical protein